MLRSEGSRKPEVLPADSASYRPAHPSTKAKPVLLSIIPSQMNELLESSKLLRSSLTRYMNACSAATKSYDSSGRQKVGSHSLSLLDSVTRELHTVVRYGDDLRVIKSTLARYRNSAFAVSLINSLPCKVLEHIFAHLSRSHGCLTHT